MEIGRLKARERDGEERQRNAGKDRRDRGREMGRKEKEFKAG